MKLELRPKERTLTGHLAKAVAATGGAHWKAESETGDLDWIIMLPGPRYGHLELKRLNERPRLSQETRMDELRALGAYVGWTDSKAGVDAFLRGLAKQAPQTPVSWL